MCCCFVESNDANVVSHDSVCYFSASWHSQNLPKQLETYFNDTKILQTRLPIFSYISLAFLEESYRLIFRCGVFNRWWVTTKKQVHIGTTRNEKRVRERTIPIEGTIWAKIKFGV